MFGAPPTPSKAELQAAEAQTASDVKWTAATCGLAYCICTIRAWAVADAVRLSLRGYRTRRTLVQYRKRDEIELKHTESKAWRQSSEYMTSFRSPLRSLLYPPSTTRTKRARPKHYIIDPYRCPQKKKEQNYRPTGL
ncbi:hypothetical protein M011DRAFT_167817 [Sporormia fimetaria CBS 119925]|uniref:Uncharacterized protein n=1 Tax=Sporormia fimetaria CBS 119925 TaxID=1340428 RepID=A0A6A6V5Q3_9PLEO|nr:hypothetical protein M011DRAFT_167817 [Sporormia fimetaria CBS 119925]